MADESEFVKKRVCKIPAELLKVFNFVDENEGKFVDSLREAISIHSVSCDLSRRKELFTMANWLAERLRFIGLTVELSELGRQSYKFGYYIDLPPVVLGYLGNDPQKKTVMFFSHYDVLPADLSDGWDTDPFKLVEKGEKFFGRGVSDNKGPCIMWFSAIEAFINVHQHLPVNIKIFMEGMEESGSLGLSNFYNSCKSFFEDVDYLVISEEPWISAKTPCLNYSLRGMLTFCIEIECCKKDLHSGTHGGALHEAMPDVIYMLEGLLGERGEILIPGLYNDVALFNVEEEKLYSKIDINPLAFSKQISCQKFIHSSKVNLLMSMWRYPSLTVHEIEGVFSDFGEKPLIPKKSHGKFSIRIVPNQKIGNVIKTVIDFMGDKWRARGSPNKYTLHSSVNSREWVVIAYEDNHNYKSAIRATKHVYGVEPQMIRSGSSINHIGQIQSICKASLLFLPLSSVEDGAHSQNENMEVRAFFSGIKLVASYLYEVAKGSGGEDQAEVLSVTKSESKKKKK